MQGCIFFLWGGGGGKDLRKKGCVFLAFCGFRVSRRGRKGFDKDAIVPVRAVLGGPQASRALDFGHCRLRHPNQSLPTLTLFPEILA